MFKSITHIFVLVNIFSLVVAIDVMKINDDGQLMSYLKTCLGNKFTLYNITNNINNNYTHIEPIELRSTLPDTLDKVLLDCMKTIVYPYHVIDFVPNQVYAIESGMYDDSSSDSEDTIDERNTIECFNLESGEFCNGDDSPFVYSPLPHLR